MATRTKRTLALLGWVILAAGWILGCDYGEQGIETACVDDGHADGPPCLQEVETEEDFERIGKAGAFGVVTKFMLPVEDDPQYLPLVFQNANRWDLHIEFLRAAFPDRFGELVPGDYLRMIYNRDSRTYFSGGMQRKDDIVEGRIYGFNVWTDLADPAEQLEMTEVRSIYLRLLAAFHPEKLVYMPTDGPAIAKAASWVDPDFPVFLGSEAVRTEVYTAGTCYGRLRRYTLSELETDIRLGRVGWQDIVVVDQVPFDVETVVAGIVTGGRQWELSHVNVRMARRGTPNLYVKDALSTLEPFDGQLVKLEATKGFSGGDDRYTISEATQAEADQWWADHRPDIGAVPPVDREYAELANLLDLDVDDDPFLLISRVGGKAGNLAKLYAFLPTEHQVPAFAIPFRYFELFLESNHIQDSRTDPPDTVTYRQYLTRLMADEQFRTDAAYRRQMLEDLRTRMEMDGQVDPALLEALQGRIETVFGDVVTKVRFRSSSNVEDSLAFSGAGLYTSTSVCAADDQDDDRDGPSRCDRDQDEERTVERGLKKVWASLFNARAWEEREWYQVPHDQASMAVLVSRAFPDERANGVAFTGNPSKSTDGRYLINVQAGDEPVVGNDPRILPERDLLEVDSDGRVEKIYRDRTSVLVPPGTYVLSDQELNRLGELLFQIDEDYPLDTGPYQRDQVLLDFEFKVDSQDQLKIKQVRPFLDKCRNVACYDPPNDHCVDENTLYDYRTNGTCDSVTGECRYDSEERICEYGCEAGQCRKAGGWISVLELNDAVLNADWGWMGGLRAYFADEPNCRRSPEHWLAECCNQVATVGSCTLFESEWEDQWRCDPPCDWDRQECVTQDEQNVCRDLPANWSLGAIELSGLKQAVELIPDTYNRYGVEDEPPDLFDQGDEITATAAGGELESFSISSTGVAHLVIDSATVDFNRDQSVSMSWTPADPDSRIQILLVSGPHHPAPPVAAILCDLPDGDGQVEVDASLVNGFLDRTWVANRFSHITRYRRQSEWPFGQEVEMTVGSMRLLQLLWR